MREVRGADRTMPKFDFVEGFWPTSPDRIDFDPSKVKVTQVDMGTMAKMQRQVQKNQWRPSTGRKIGFFVHHEHILLGIIVLAGPVINLTVRDEYLGLNDRPEGVKKGTLLREYADMSVCAATQPFGWRWNGGKLMAMIATTLAPYWTERYGDRLRGIITTSIYGKSIQYDRIYKMIGYTKGFGHVHISDEEYEKMKMWLRVKGIPLPSSRFGAGFNSNARMATIALYIQHSKDPKHTERGLQHGRKRGVYYHDAIDDSLEAVVRRWYDRWGKPRADRLEGVDAPYNNGYEGIIEIPESVFSDAKVLRGAIDTPNLESWFT